MKTILALIMLPMMANATSMCVHTGSYVASLSIYDNGVSHTTGNNGAWTVTMGYNTSSSNTPYVSGYAGCAEVGASNAIDTVDTTVGITGGEESGPYCWCVMRKPLVSYSVLAHKDYADTATCALNCADKCGEKVQTSTAFRTAMFEAVW